MPSDSPGNRAVGYRAHEKRHGLRARGSLAGRISLVTTLVALLTATIVGLVVISQIRAQATEQARSSLERAADTVAGAIERTGSLQRGQVTLAGLRAGGVQIDRVYPGGKLPDIMGPADLAALNAGGDLSAERQTPSGLVFLEARTLSDGSILILIESDDVTSVATTQSLTTLGLALASGVAFAVLAGMVLARRLARPLQVAAGAANRMAQGERDVVLAPQGPQEVAEVAESLNDLNDALGVSEARQREFLLSVSHELRTPLTSIHGYAEALADGVVGPDDVKPTAAIMVREAQRLDRLVSDLLDLARMGAREVRIDAVDVDVATILAEAAAVWSGLCAAEGVRFSSELPTGPLAARTDAVRIRQIIDNLMANALRMTPSGRGIELLGRVSETTVVLEVSDGGPGLTEDDLAVAFEPAELYSRYRGVRVVGSGVGLALVGRLAERLGGGAQAGLAADGGAKFTITLARYLESAPDPLPRQTP